MIVSVVKGRLPHQGLCEGIDATRPIPSRGTRFVGGRLGWGLAADVRSGARHLTTCLPRHL